MIIYYFTDFSVVEIQQIEQMLLNAAPQQVELVRSLKTLSRQREQAVSYVMLAYALQYSMEQVTSDDTLVESFPAEWLGQTVDNPPIWELAEHGKPFLTNYDGIHFNISHCREAIVTAISNNPVGIDVEGRRRFSDGLLQRAFNDEEQGKVKDSVDPEMEFARIWTRKESYFKYTGTGILIDHLPEVERLAVEGSCVINTCLIEPPSPALPFYLSVAQEKSASL